MSMKLVPDTAFRYGLRGVTLVVVAVWMVVTYIVGCHPPLVLNVGGVALFVVAASDLVTARRMRNRN